MRSTRCHLRRCSAWLLIFLLATTAVHAHERLTPLEQWGPFLPDTVTCLRALSRATRRCFDTVLLARESCRDAAERGESCDVTALDERIASQIAKVRAAVVQRCSLGQLTELSFPGGILDAQTDLTSACRDQSSAVIEMTHTATVSECVAATAKYARKAIRFVVRRKTRVMDRMAARVFTGGEKVHRAQSMSRRLEAGALRWAAGLRDGCPQFEEIYGRSAESFVQTLKDRADCIVSATHGNAHLVCIRQICGNGIREEQEECDDGNSDDADACATDCTLN